MTALEEIKKPEHERIWLEPAGAPDRCWCQDNQWGDEGVEYVLASTLETLQREKEALKNLIDGDNCADPDKIDALFRRAEKAESEVKRLQAEIDRKSSMPGDHRYWEGLYRDEAAENEKLRGLLTPFAKFDLSELKQRAFLQILVCPQGDDHDDNYAPHFTRARTALSSTGGEHNAE